MTFDPVTAVREYSPIADRGVDAEIVTVRERVYAELDLATVAPLTFRSRHRRATAVAALAAITFAGVGVAAAAGVPLPDDVRQTFRSFTDDSSGHRGAALADPATASLIFSAPGPKGTQFEGWKATNKHGGLCVTTTFEQAQRSKAPHDVAIGGGQCAVAHAPRGLFAEGAGNSLVGSNDRADFVWEAGDAVRAELHVSTGKVYPVAIQHGWLGGWFGIDRIPIGASALIVAYGADGRVLGTMNAVDQAGCPNTAQPC